MGQSLFFLKLKWILKEGLYLIKKIRNPETTMVERFFGV
jgi:hypothetical protein